MEHSDLYALRETYNQQGILLCFNGPFSQGLIEEIGNALKRYMLSSAASSSSAMDIFAVYIEIAQNIQQYSAQRGYDETEASATVVIGREPEGKYVITAGNVVEAADGDLLAARINSLSGLDKAQLKAAYREQLRKPREEDATGGAGLGLIDMARKATEPMTCSLHPLEGANRVFFSLRVVI